MAIQNYIQPANSGAQMWQMLWSNTTGGTHPYNFGGFCAALVAQWLLEIKFAAGATPEELGRHLLQADLGQHGYGGIASSQAIYGSHAPAMNNHTALFDRHSGGALSRRNQVSSQTADEHWTHMRAGIYNIPADETIRLQDAARVFSGHIGISGNNSWLLRQIGFGDTWGHAIGLHSDAVRVYFFDPNYGVAIFDSHHQGTMANFVRDIWTQYGVTTGRFAEVV